MSHSRTIFACIISAALAAGVMFLIGFRPVDTELLEIKNHSLREENQLLRRQVELLTEQKSVLKQLLAVREHELAAINEMLQSE